MPLLIFLSGFPQEHPVWRRQLDDHSSKSGLGRVRDSPRGPGLGSPQSRDLGSLPQYPPHPCPSRRRPALRPWLRPGPGVSPSLSQPKSRRKPSVSRSHTHRTRSFLTAPRPISPSTLSCRTFPYGQQVAVAARVSPARAGRPSPSSLPRSLQNKLFRFN